MTTPFNFSPGSTPLLICMPHTGTHIPASLQGRYQARALQVEDTDWHMPQLYEFASAMGASVLQGNYSRYVIDLNRPPDNAPMYPGASNTELCPTRFFTGDNLYRQGQEPDSDEEQERLALYWEPYHAKLRATLDELRAKHGYALLWDAHSIRQEIPWLFEGKLPGLNLGTASGKSCSPALRERLTQRLEQGQRQSPSFSYAVDGRFKGGYTTRHYGAPEQQIHVAQMEMAQALYMQEHLPFAYLPDSAKQVQVVLQDLLSTMLHWSPE
jgi:N-formylglutamate deformylase